MKKALALILTLIMVLGLMPAAMAATEPTTTPSQIGSYYDKDGKLTGSSGPSQLSYEQDKVFVSKTIAQTGKENEFEITLEVKTTETIENVSSAPDAAVVLVLDVSGSMGEGRLSSAKAAAQAFINSFAKDAGNAQRKVAIVKFSGEEGFYIFNQYISGIDGAKTVQGWTEASSLVKTDGQQCAAIENLSAGGGTNLHAGLLLAKNLLNDSSVKNIENKSIVLLSDGKPTFYVKDKEADSQSIDVICEDGNSMGGDGGNTSHNTHTKVETLMKSDDLKGINKYAVYIGDENIECTEESSCRLDKPTSDWLRSDCGFSTYSVSDLTSLTGIFENIVKSILIKAQAWMVTDPMGTNIQFAGFTYRDSNATNEDNGTISWDLKKDNKYTTDTQGTTTTRTYTCKYNVKLDTLAQGFEANKEYPTNGITTLTYVIEKEGQTVTEADLKTAYFNVPSVKGFAGDLTFTKVGANNEPLAGAAFKITANDDPNWSMDGTPSANGTSFTFTGIPSGHTYTLTETQTPEGYQSLDGTYTVEVAYGEAVLKKGADTVTDIVNTPKETPTGSLTITKEFGNDSAFNTENWANATGSKQLTFTIQKVNDDGTTAGTTGDPTTVTLPIDGESNNPWSATVDLAPGTYTVTESDAEVTGYDLTVSNDKQGTSNDGKTGTVAVMAAEASTITFTNTYTPETIITYPVQIKKEASGLPEGTTYPNVTVDIMKGNEKIETINDLVPNGNAQIVYLPAGEYTVEERRETAGVDGYILDVKNAELKVTAPVVAERSTAPDAVDTVPIATITNTYTKMEDDTGSLTVKKTVSGGGASYNKEFTFTVTLTVNNDPLNGEVGGVTFTNGVATFTLKHNQEKSITGIPAGYTYTVTENADGYTQSITSGSATGTIEKGKTATVTFNNYKSGGDHYYPTPDPVPPIVIPPNTGDMTIWQSILHFLGIR